MLLWQHHGAKTGCHWLLSTRCRCRPVHSFILMTAREAVVLVPFYCGGIEAQRRWVTFLRAPSWASSSVPLCSFLSC